MITLMMLACRCLAGKMLLSKFSMLIGAKVHLETIGLLLLLLYIVNRSNGHHDWLS